MIGFDTHQVERKIITILKTLSESSEPMGARLIARQLKEQGVELGERAVRYHLKLMDERGLTRSVGKRDGREITHSGCEELSNALVTDKIGFVLEKIELLAFRTSFDVQKLTGLVPVNISFFLKKDFSRALQSVKATIDAGLGLSRLIAVAQEKERLGEVIVPRGQVGLATVCSIIINGTLLKAGVPTDSRFGGVLQVKNRQPLRFVNLINYSGTTLDPSEVFIRAKMTDVQGAIRTGSGKILANFREIPAQCQRVVEETVSRLGEAGLGGMLIIGNVSESLCGIPMSLNRIGMILLGGLNPVAAAEEMGISAENYAMSTLIEYHDLTRIENLA